MEKYTEQCGTGNELRFLWATGSDANGARSWLGTEKDGEAKTGGK